MIWNHSEHVERCSDGCKGLGWYFRVRQGAEARGPFSTLTLASEAMQRDFANVR